MNVCSCFYHTNNISNININNNKTKVSKLWSLNFSISVSMTTILSLIVQYIYIYIYMKLLSILNIPLYGPGYPTKCAYVCQCVGFWRNWFINCHDINFALLALTIDGNISNSKLSTQRWMTGYYYHDVARRYVWISWLYFCIVVM